jgi:hypothetical protein
VPLDQKIGASPRKSLLEFAIGDAASAAPHTEPGLQALGGDFFDRVHTILQFAILILQFAIAPIR